MQHCYHTPKDLADYSDDELLETVDDQARTSNANVVRGLITPWVNAQQQQDAAEQSADLLGWED